MRKILTCCGVLIASLIVVSAFMTATTYIQLALATFLYPLVVFLAFKAFPRKALSSPSEEAVTITQQTFDHAKIPEEPKKENMMGITDIDKRVFLKLIGGLGISMFLFSIFNKKAEGMFFKSLPGPGKVSLENIAGNKIDPAENQPTDGYRISEVDDDAITYYGFTNKDGAWFVMRQDPETGSFRYTRGKSNFPGNWTNRGNLIYDYYNDVF